MTHLTGSYDWAQTTPQFLVHMRDGFDMSFQPPIKPELTQLQKESVIAVWAEQRSPATKLGYELDYSCYIYSIDSKGACTYSLALSMSFNTGTRIEPVVSIMWDYAYFEQMEAAAEMVSERLQSRVWHLVVPAILAYNRESRKSDQSYDSKHANFRSHAFFSKDAYNSPN